jgi:hypothetical protein
MFQGISMATQFTQAEAHRFLRTLRVTTQTALAQYDLQNGRAAGRPVVTFQALAAKGAGEWRFPGSGLMSADGLALATLLRDASGAVLELQAQGLVGLSLYANRPARVSFASGLTVEGVFDRDGRMRLPIVNSAISDADLSAFELQIVDEAP